MWLPKNIFIVDISIAAHVGITHSCHNFGVYRRAPMFASTNVRGSKRDRALSTYYSPGDSARDCATRLTRRNEHVVLEFLA